jgi:N-acyl-L-homoserine lactone synthetase
MYEYKIFHAHDCPEDLFRFRYSIYVEEMGRRQLYACHKTKTIRDYLDDTAHQGVVFKDGKIIACMRVNFLRDGPIGHYYDFYRFKELESAKLQAASICTRLMVAREYRRTVVSIEILKFLYKYGLYRDIATCTMDCNLHLVRFFEKFGYQFLFSDKHPEYGNVAVLRLDLRDLNSLDRTHSPFAPICREYFSNLVAAE